ncbi:MAG: lysozyme inhibitor LprI family protein [Terriglobales bacterium]|jgi:uncharacterized protein YecT (DUF1311 family)
MRVFEHFIRAFFVLLLAFAVASTFGVPLVCAAGQVQHETAPCGAEIDTAAMRGCETLRYRQAEEELDATYAKLMAKLDPTSRGKLRAAEAAWLQFRKTNADFQADTARGGTLAPLIRITVMSDMTEARVAELKKSLRP